MKRRDWLIFAAGWLCIALSVVLTAITHNQWCVLLFFAGFVVFGRSRRLTDIIADRHP